MNSKREVFAASVLAIGLVVGLGTISYSLFSEASAPQRFSNALDVFTQQGGVGINISDGNYQPLDNVSIHAYVSHAGIGIENQSVTFRIERPQGAEIVKTALTDETGYAEANISLLPSEGDVVGTWRVFATTNLNSEAVNDALNFDCKSQSAVMVLFSERNGVSSISFLPNDTVLLEAQVSFRNASLAGTPVTFDVRTPNSTQFLLQTVNADGAGSANITYRIPWPSDISIGIWQISVSSEVYGQSLEATTNLQCYFAPKTIDIFTQYGGRGPNSAGGYFSLNGTVDLYAEVRDEFNQTVPGLPVNFLVRDPNGTDIAYYARTTDSSGIANVTFGIRPDVTYGEIFEIYGRTQYYGSVLLDTLTFIVKQN